MSTSEDHENSEAETPEEDADAKADVIAICVMFTAAVLIAAHFISGFTIDL